EEKGFLSRTSRASDSTTVQDYELYTPDEEAAVVKKLDRKMVLFMGLLYMLSFLDRSNIGNARIAGLTDDLKLSSAQYEWLLTGFYITYIAFEWLTLMYRVFPPHIYISLCVFSWGLLASLQSIVPSFVPLLLLRGLLGIGEAAFGPGVPFYLSFFFRRDELAFRTGLFISAAPLSTSFASSLAWLITKLGEGGPIAPWRLLFLIEGFPSLFVAVWAWRLIPDGPGSARWLSERQREVAVLRLRKEREVVDDDEDEKIFMDEERTGRSGLGSKKQKGLNMQEIWQTLKDPKCYLTAIMFFSCNVAFSSLPVFLPTIIQEMGHSALTSQALSAPPYLLSFLLVLGTARLSDRHATRSPFLAFHALLAFSGYALIALAGHHRLPAFWRYVGVYPATIGFFSAVTLIITWTINNQDSDTKKGTGMAVLNVVGQCGPLLGTRLYPDDDKPYYVRGMLVCAVFMAAVGVLALGLRFVLAREN
ncbi:MFS transporter-like protein, partial [Saccharata proteae CBS 121410]